MASEPRSTSSLNQGRSQFGIVSPAGSYLSANDKRVHFGLGSDRMVSLLEITWPSGTVQSIRNVPGDRIMTVLEPAKARK